MSSKDFKQAFVEIEKEGSLKNAEHQFSDMFYFITQPNVNRFEVMTLQTLYETYYKYVVGL